MRFLFMKLLYFLIVLSSISGFAQQPIELKIESIKAEDSKGERKFTISYSVTNLTDKKVSFFQKPENLISNNGGSLSNCPYYKIYQGEKFLNLGNVFNRPDRAGNDPNTITIDMKNPTANSEGLKWLKENYILKDSLVEALTQAGDKNRAEKVSDSLYQELIKGKYTPKGLTGFKPRSVMSQIITLDPHESKTYVQTGSWNKDRYFFHDPEEYYLDEKSNYYFEITFVLLKEHLKSKMTDEEFAKVMADNSFIKGVFVSNKMQIDFN